MQVVTLWGGPNHLQKTEVYDETQSVIVRKEKQLLIGHKEVVEGRYVNIGGVWIFEGWEGETDAIVRMSKRLYLNHHVSFLALACTALSEIGVREEAERPGRCIVAPTFTIRFPTTEIADCMEISFLTTSREDL